MLARIGWLLYLPFQKIMTQRNIVALEADGGICLYVFFVLFVCCSLLCFVTCFPSFLPSLFFVTDFVSVLPSGTNSYSLFLARKKMDDNSGGGGGGGGF